MRSKSCKVGAGGSDTSMTSGSNLPKMFHDSRSEKIGCAELEDTLDKRVATCGNVPENESCKCPCVNYFETSAMDGIDK